MAIAVLGIQFFWVVLGLSAVLAFAATDCSTPKCKTEEAATAEVIVWIVFLGYITSLAVYFFRRNRKAGRS